MQRTRPMIFTAGLWLKSGVIRYELTRPDLDSAKRKQSASESGLRLQCSPYPKDAE